MNKRVKRLLSKYIVPASIESLSFERGYGIIPARFKLLFTKGEKKYLLEIEANFRVLNNGKSILVFDDMFLDECCHEFSIEEYQKQKGIEKSLLFHALCNANNLCSNKKVYKVRVSKCGDVSILVHPKIELQIINDSHNIDDCIFRLRDCQKKKEYITNSGIQVGLLLTIFEVKNSLSDDLTVSSHDT